MRHVIVGPNGTADERKKDKPQPLLGVLIEQGLVWGRTVFCETCSWPCHVLTFQDESCFDVLFELQQPDGASFSTPQYNLIHQRRCIWCMAELALQPVLQVKSEVSKEALEKLKSTNQVPEPTHNRSLFTQEAYEKMVKESAWEKTVKESAWKTPIYTSEPSDPEWIPNTLNWINERSFKEWEEAFARLKAEWTEWGKQMSSRNSVWGASIIEQWAPVFYPENSPYPISSGGLVKEMEELQPKEKFYDLRLGAPYEKTELQPPLIKKFTGKRATFTVDGKPIVFVPEGYPEVSFEPMVTAVSEQWRQGMDKLFGAYRWRIVQRRGTCFVCQKFVDGPVIEKERGTVRWIEHEKCVGSK